MGEPRKRNGRTATDEVRRRSPSRRRHRREVLAALDLGTNNCRLLIARPADDGFQVIDGFSRVVRLGEGMGETGMLSAAAIERTLDALTVCASKMARRHVGPRRCVATEAARRAGNCEDFLAQVRERAGIELEIISSREEAELTLIGCLPLLDHNTPYALIFDVGGGSAEIVWLKLDREGGHQIVGWVSLPVGVVTLTERNGGHDFSREAYLSTVAEIAEMLRPFEERHGIRARIEAGVAQMLGTAGTVTTIAGVTMGLRRYNRTLVDGSYLDLSAVHTVSRNLACSTYEQRAAHPSIGRNRADLVVAGCAVLEAVCQTWPAARIRVADRGVREGILLHMTAGRDEGRLDAAE